jgi:hypothetical protein
MIRMLCLLGLCLCLCAFKGCDDERKPTDPPPPAPAPTSVKENESDAAKAAKLAAAIDAEKNEAARLKLEIELLRLQKSIADKASKDAETRIELKQKELEAVKLEALQTKLYISAGVLALVTAVLVALAVYFKSAHMIYWACGSGGIACLVAFAGFLTPYVYWIAGGGMLALIGFVCWLLFGRDKALFQLTKGMNDIKAHVPQYRGILREHIDSAQDKIIDATRKRWHDPQV